MLILRRRKRRKMAESEYHLLSTTDINVVADLQKYTQDKWKPILMSSCAIVAASKASVHVTILTEREK
jgi:hypothetical protein